LAFTLKELNEAILLLTLFVTLVSCAQSQVKSDKEYIIGKTLKTHRDGNLLLSRQPTDKELKDLKDDGVKTVINLRSKTEYNEKSERDFLQSSGIKYINIPFTKLSDSYIDQVTKAVVENRKNGKVLIHCSRGSRIGIWLGGHFYKDHSYSKEKSLETAKELGLTKSAAIEKVEEYLSNK
jgi:protein tyrosine phosphatase (PTP) superfamily phosphohydrolase (DUF442 family)